MKYDDLYQTIQEIEEDMSLANASTIEENIRLSQIHPNMEPFLYNMSVSQAVDYYHLETFDLGDLL